MENIKRNDIVEVFDAAAWQKVGDIGDNHCHWKRGVVHDIIIEGHTTKITVLVEDGRKFKGLRLQDVRVPLKPVESKNPCLPGNPLFPLLF